MKKLIHLCSILFLHSFAVAQQGESLASVTAEYSTKRTAGLNRLSVQAKTSLESVKKAQMAIANLEGSNATEKAIGGLPALAANPAATPDPAAPGLPADAGAILTDHATKLCNGVIGLNKLFLPRFEALKTNLLQSGDLAGANAAVAKVKQLNEENALLAPIAAPKTARKEELATSFTVEGLVDGDTELHVTKEGIYWVVLGDKAKVGYNKGDEEPTFVDGVRWKPKWRTKGDRGPDTSDVYPFPNASPALVPEQALVSERRFGKEINRTASTHAIRDDHLVVSFKDPEGGRAWYKIRFKAP